MDARARATFLCTTERAHVVCGSPREKHTKQKRPPLEIDTLSSGPRLWFWRRGACKNDAK